MALVREATNDNIWDAVNGLVLVEEENGIRRMISIDTINGRKVRNLVETKHTEKVKEVFPNGLPAGMSMVFVSVAD